LVAVATRLVARGLQTTLLAPQRYGELVTDTGVEFASIGADDVFAEVFDGATCGPQTAAWQLHGAIMAPRCALG
jgi:rhamnosyltransferase subunit B